MFAKWGGSPSCWNTTLCKIPTCSNSGSETTLAHQICCFCNGGLCENGGTTHFCFRQSQPDIHLRCVSLPLTVAVHPLCDSCVVNSSTSLKCRPITKQDMLHETVIIHSLHQIVTQSSASCIIINLQFVECLLKMERFPQVDFGIFSAALKRHVALCRPLILWTVSGKQGHLPGRRSSVTLAVLLNFVKTMRILAIVVEGLLDLRINSACISP